MFDKVFPAVGIVFLEEDRRHFFSDIGGHAPDAVAGDEGHHIVFERDQIFGVHQHLFSQMTGSCGV